MEPSSNQQNKQEIEKSNEDALHDTIRLIVSGYLKNNLDKNNNPSSKHFAKGLQQSIDSGIQLKNPNSKDAKVATFLKYLNNDKGGVDVHEEDSVRQMGTRNESPLLSLTHEIAEDFAIDITSKQKLDQLAEAVFQSEIDILIKRGQGGDLESSGVSSWNELDTDNKEKYRHNVEQKRQEQVRGIEKWIKYIAGGEADVYPSWYKYFVVTSLRSMGVEQFELGTYTYGGRDHKTLFRFPTLNPAVLAKVYDRMLAAHNETVVIKDKQTGEEKVIPRPIPSKYEIQDTSRTSIDDAEKLFLYKYAKEANFTQLYAYELSKYKEATLESKRSSEGVWVKYNQQKEGSKELKAEAKKLSESLENKGTEWCTEGTNFSESQLAGGDFYVYYTREDFDKDTYGVPLEDMTEEEKRDVATMPRIAIKMYDGRISELRGIVGGQEQDLEPEMLAIAEAKCQGDTEKGEEPLGGKEEYEKKAEDMKKLLVLIQKQEKGTVFTREDLLFLYEVNGSIEGFGHNEDPRIEEIKGKRNRQEDIQTICNCPPEHIAKDFIDINENTNVFYEDNGKKITFLDFRLEENQKKLPQLLELSQKIIETGSPARPDMEVFGGIANCSFDRENVKDGTIAFKSFEEADNGTPSYIWNEWNNVDFAIPEGDSFETLVLSYNSDPNIRQSSEKILEDMDKLGLRPLTLEEMTIAGITHPEFTKTSPEFTKTSVKYFVGLTPYSLAGSSFVPGLYWSGGLRYLSSNRFGDGLDGHYRFLCARK